jgi:hypothetical protein
MGGPPVDSVVGGGLEAKPEVDICQYSVEANIQVIRFRPYVPTPEADIIILSEEPIEAGACMIAEGVVIFGKRGYGGGLVDVGEIITASALHVRYECTCGNHQSGIQDQINRSDSLIRADRGEGTALGNEHVGRVVRLEYADGGTDPEVLRKVPLHGNFPVTSDAKVLEFGGLGEIASELEADHIFSCPLGRSLPLVGCVGGTDDMGQCQYQKCE